MPFGDYYLLFAIFFLYAASQAHLAESYFWYFVTVLVVCLIKEVWKAGRRDIYNLQNKIVQPVPLHSPVPEYFQANYNREDNPDKIRQDVNWVYEVFWRVSKRNAGPEE